jgi:hypothetical protein
MSIFFAVAAAVRRDIKKGLYDLDRVKTWKFLF